MVVIAELAPVTCEHKLKYWTHKLHNSNTRISILHAQVTRWLVGCGFTLHSAIFELYSDGTVVQFSNLDLLPAPNAMGS